MENGRKARLRGACQLCGSERNPTLHHIIPQCLENGIDTPKNISDKYSESFLAFYDVALQYVPVKKLEDFRKEIGARIGEDANLISLCDCCHSKLNKGELGDNDLSFCPEADRVPENLSSLQERDVHLFFEYWILEALVKSIVL